LEGPLRTTDHQLTQLVLWHVAGEPLKADETTRRKGLYAAARLIGLTVANPRGRPKKKKSETGLRR